MLHIYPVCVELLRDIKPLAEQIATYDKDQARQLRRSSASVLLNVAEGGGGRGGTLRARYHDALGSARESFGNLEGAEAVGYIGPMSPVLRNRFDHIIGVLVKVLYKR